MVLETGTLPEIDWLLEQLDACHDLAHKYKCAICGERQGKEPVLVVQDLPDGGIRVIIVTACRDCAPHVKGLKENK